MLRRPKQSLLATTTKLSSTMLKPQNYSSIWAGKHTIQKHFAQNGKPVPQRRLREQKRSNPSRTGHRDSLRQLEVDLKQSIKVEMGLLRTSNLHLLVSITSRNVCSSFSSSRFHTDKLDRGTILCAQAWLPYQWSSVSSMGWSTSFYTSILVRTHAVRYRNLTISLLSATGIDSQHYPGNMSALPQSGALHSRLVALRTYPDPASCTRWKFYNTLSTIVLSVPRYPSALIMLEDSSRMCVFSR